jgi:hypothetical protein
VRSDRRALDGDFPAIGSEFVGNPVLQYAQSFHVRAPQLRSLLPGKPA